MKITLTGQPQSTNHIYKSSCVYGYLKTYMTSAGVALKEDYQWQASSQYKKPPLTERLSVTAVFYFGNKRMVDIDNFSKILWDSLTGIVWEDDSQVDEYHIYRAYSKENPRVELTIHTLPHSSPSPDV